MGQVGGGETGAQHHGNAIPLSRAEDSSDGLTVLADFL
jgi:hypothetical protein